MSGEDVPYQLRPNKCVERQLFLDILDFVRVWNGPSRYVYASMGGKFLEDFKLINDRFAIEQMISIEGDRLTWERQQFNKPLGFVECRHQMSGEFVDNFSSLVADNSDHRFIVWLDFASASERGSQLAEYEDLISRMSSGDVAKITLNANPQWLRRRSDFQHLKDYLEKVFGAIDEQLGEYKPSKALSEESLTAYGFAALLASAVKIAALKGIQGDGALSVEPLAAYLYADGEHAMLTVTAIVADEGLRQRIREDAVFGKWEFRSFKWDDLITVRVPDLSLRERQVINSWISSETDCHSIHYRLPFRLHKKKAESVDLVRSYIKHYRRVPGFGRVQ